MSVCYDVPVTTLQITLDNDVYDRLAARARQRSLTVEQMVEQAAAAEAEGSENGSDAAAMAREHMARSPRTSSNAFRSEGCSEHGLLRQAMNAAIRLQHFVD